MFKKTLTAVAVAAVAVVSGFNSAAAEEEKILNIYNWSDYIDPEIIPMFEKETGIKVVYDVSTATKCWMQRSFQVKQATIL